MISFVRQEIELGGSGPVLSQNLPQPGTLVLPVFATTEQLNCLLMHSRTILQQTLLQSLTDVATLLYQHQSFKIKLQHTHEVILPQKGLTSRYYHTSQVPERLQTSPQGLFAAASLSRYKPT